MPKISDRKMRVILCGVDYDAFDDESYYKLKVFHWPVFAYNVMMFIGFISAFFLTVAAISVNIESLTILKVAPWSMATMVILCLLAGIFLKQSRYLTPFRVLCGLGRVLSLVSLAFLLVFILGCAIHDSTRQKYYRGKTCVPCEKTLRNNVLFLLFSTLLFHVLGFCADAAVRCDYFFQNQK